MRKQKYLDSVILLGFLSLVIPGVSLLAKTEMLPIETDDVISDKAILNQLSSLFMARNTKKIAEYIAQNPQEQQLRLVNQVLNDQKNPLEVTDKIKLVLELARKTENRNYRVNLYNTLIENEQVAKQKPLLYIAAEGNYEDLIGSIADWLSEHTDIFTDWFYRAVNQAIKENQPDIANKLLSRFLTISPDLSTKLLWEVVRGKKNANFIAPLVKRGANINSEQQGRTPLIAAVENDDLSLVEALLNNGAKEQINKFVDPAVGTALQTALRIQKKNPDMELLLRKYGAHE
jgi:flavodoxin